MLKIVIFIIVMLFTSPTFATVFFDCSLNTAPSSEESGGVYTCSTGSVYLYLSGGGGSIYEHTTNEGYGGTGAAKFYSTGLLQNADRWLYLSSPTTGSQRNTRYLIKFESYGTHYDGKWSDQTDSNGWRTFYHVMARGGCEQTANQFEMSFDGTLTLLHGQGETSNPCGGYYWCANSAWGDTWPGTVTSCTIVEQNYIELANYTGQWISVEIEKNSSGQLKFYIDTQDGAFSGIYYWFDTTFSGNIYPVSPGAYLQGTTTGNKYFIIDNIVVADTYIGPPAGFTGTTPQSVQGLRIEGVNLR